MQAFLSLLKRLGEAAGGAAVIFAAISTYTALVGGHLPPWASYGFAQTLQSQQNAQAATQELLARDYYQDKLDVAQIEQSKHPDSETVRREVRDLKWRLKILDAQLSTAGAGAAPR